MSFNLLTSALDWRQSHLGRLLGHAMRRFDDRVLELMARHIDVPLALANLAARDKVSAAHIHITRHLPLNGARLTELAAMAGMSKQAMGDLVYVELPRVGETISAGDRFGVVESVKAASDVYMPVAGEVTAVNSALESAPEGINQDPYGAGWMIRIRPTRPADVADLLDAAAYQAQLDAEEA